MMLRAFLAGISLNGFWIAACRPMGKPDFRSQPAVIAGALRMSAKILIIDGEADIREMISKMLTMEGYRIISVADGQENQALPKKLEELPIKAPLIQLFNYRCRHQCLEGELVRAERYRIPLSLLMLDADQAHRQGGRQGPHVLGRECRTGSAGPRVLDRKCRTKSVRKNDYIWGGSSADELFQT
jgi:PleD family two-component response regulator